MASNPRIDDLRSRLAAEPGSRLFAQLGEELRKAGELAEAVGVCREGLQKQPGYASARMTLGRALMEGGELEKARGEFEEVLQGAPQNILAGRYLGECLEGLGESGAALGRYRTTLVLAPGDEQLMSRIRSLEGGGRAGGAAPSGEPAAGGATVGAGSAPPVDGGKATVEPAYDLEFDSIGLQEAPRTSPKTLPFEAGVEEVAAQLSGPGAGGGTDVAQGPLASTTLAELYLSQGLTEKAIEVYREVLEREPGNEQARERLAALEAPTVRSEAAEAPAPDPRLERRRGVERTIRRLEALLAAFGRA